MTKSTNTAKSGKTNTTPRTAADVHAEAIKLGLEVHRTGEVLHKTVSKAEPMDYVWGCAFGHQLALSAMHAIRLNAELGFAADEGVRNLLDDAYRNLNGSTALNGLDRRGLAVGVISTIAALAAHAIEHGEAFALVESLRVEAVDCAMEADAEHSQQLKARAMAKRADRIEGGVTA